MSGYEDCPVSVSHPHALLTITVLAEAQLMCWRILASRKTDLYIVQKAHWQLHDMDEILDAYAFPIGPHFILMDYNARPQRARVTDEYPQTTTMERMDWPARSPDLSPIEHARVMLQIAISARPVQSTMVQKLQQALLDAWARIPQQTIRRLISSMRRRWRELIQSNGHHLKRNSGPLLDFSKKPHFCCCFFFFYFSVLSRIIAPTKYQPLCRFNGLSAHSFLLFFFFFWNKANVK